MIGRRGFIAGLVAVAAMPKLALAKAKPFFGYGRTNHYTVLPRLPAIEAGDVLHIETQTSDVVRCWIERGEVMHGPFNATYAPPGFASMNVDSFTFAMPPSPGMELYG
jgi:hypothetical protein